MTHPVLKLTLEAAGHRSKVELNGQDISSYLTGVTVSCSVDSPTTATLHYLGDVVIDMHGGSVSFKQDVHYVKCGDCGSVVSGQEREEVRIIDVSSMDAVDGVGHYKRYAAVKE